MPPKFSSQDQPELFRSALVNLVDPKHPLVRLFQPMHVKTPASRPRRMLLIGPSLCVVTRFVEQFARRRH